MPRKSTRKRKLSQPKSQSEEVSRSVKEGPELGEGSKGLLLEQLEAPGSAVQVAVDDFSEENNVNRLVELILEACGAMVKVEGVKDIAEAVKEAENIVGEALPKGKDARVFRERFSGFWKAISSEVSLEVLGEWLAELTCSHRKAIRIMSCTASFALIDGWVATLGSERKAKSGFESQLATELKKKKPNQAKAKQHKTSISEVSTRISTFEAMIRSIMENVFCKRYRDIHPEIRAMCISNLGNWMTLDDSFHSPSYTKFIGWSLNDRSSLVRKSALSSLTSAFSVPSLSQPIQLFGEKYIGRILEMIHDIDDPTAAMAIDLITVMYKHIEDLPQMNEDALDQIPELLWDISAGIRTAAAKHIYETVFSLEAPSDEVGALARDKEDIIALVGLFSECKPKDSEADIELVAETFVTVLWKQFDCLRNWKAYLDIFEDDSSTDSSPTILSHILVCAAKLTQNDALSEKGSKSRKAASETAYSALSHVFVPRITDLLTRFQSESAVTERFARLIQYFDLGIFEDVNTRESYLKPILLAMKKLYFMTIDAGCIETLSSSLAVLFSLEGNQTQEVQHALVVQLMEGINVCESSLGNEDDEDHISLIAYTQRILSIGLKLRIPDFISAFANFSFFLSQTLKSPGDYSVPSSNLLRVGLSCVYWGSRDYLDLSDPTEISDFRNEFSAVTLGFLENIPLALRMENSVSSTAFGVFSDCLVLLNSHEDFVDIVTDDLLAASHEYVAQRIQDFSSNWDSRPERDHSDPEFIQVLASACKSVISEHKSGRAEATGALVLSCFTKFDENVDTVLKAFMTILKKSDMGILLKFQLRTLQVLWEQKTEAKKIKEIATKLVMLYGFDSYRMSFLEFFRFGVDFALSESGEDAGFLTCALVPFLQRSSPTNAVETLKYFHERNAELEFPPRAVEILNEFETSCSRRAKVKRKRSVASDREGSPRAAPVRKSRRLSAPNNDEDSTRVLDEDSLEFSTMISTNDE